MIVHQHARSPRKDQAARLRELMAQGPSGAMTLAVTSGKGGVGKSNVAVNLSICLAAHGLRVTLVDVDLGLANADLLMNLQPRYTLSHLMTGVRDIETCVFILNSRCPNADGFCTFLHLQSADPDYKNACMLPYTVEMLEPEIADVSCLPAEDATRVAAAISRHAAVS